MTQHKLVKNSSVLDTICFAKCFIQCLLRLLQLQSLLPFQQVSPTENVIEEYGLSGADLPKQLFL